MDIFEVLNFSFTEFITSVPGILIVVGILLTIIAIILLLTDKKSKGAPVQATTPVGAVDASVPPVPEVQPNGVAPVEQVNEAVEQAVAPVTNDLGNAMPLENAQPNEMNTVQEMPVNEPAVMPVENNQNVDQGLVLNTEVAPMTSEVAPVTPVVEQPVTAPVEEVVTPVVEPVVEQRQIYGGANPLENTTTIPTVRVPYNGAQVVTPDMNMNVNANVQEVVNAPVMDASQTMAAPVVNEPMPTVVPEVAQPVMEPVVEPVVTPVVEPVQPTAPVVEQPVAPVSTPVASQPAVTDEIETLEF